MTPTIYKQLDVKGNIIAFKLLCRNDNRKTIETVDVLPLAEAGLNDEQIIDVLSKNNVYKITPRELQALQLRDDNPQMIQLSRKEYDFAVSHGLTFSQIQELRKLCETLQGYKIKADGTIK